MYIIQKNNFFRKGRKEKMKNFCNNLLKKGLLLLNSCRKSIKNPAPECGRDFKPVEFAGYQNIPGQYFLLVRYPQNAL